MAYAYGESDERSIHNGENKALSFEYMQCSTEGYARFIAFLRWLSDVHEGRTPMSLLQLMLSQEVHSSLVSGLEGLTDYP
jgi:hypothetical protein